MSVTAYFREQVLRKRPYLTEALCRQVLAAPTRRETQEDGRLRFWAKVIHPADGAPRFLRVIVLEDGVTIHNAFFDRDFDGAAS